ncbi:glycosyl transferase family 2 [Tersicoccus phoenicis]|uniref:Glycosyl transferase family 2 n=1 Tax=Tersicoccus phoenicis TaxID=554083 RepID=A0A1R1LB18_9MICC|nr:glycosyltransferase family A protein [Tersicoccus phoenicis]OMH24741.1 glycosyl transferase family 2 [Tersicoccus phoenicis]
MQSGPCDAPPTVSVVIPVKDDAAELARCLLALARQTHLPDEIVVVDNDSTDASADVARHAGARVIACPQPGIPAASAAGYDAADGDLILRLDADCVPTATWIATVVSAFERHPDVAAFTGYARFIDGPTLVRTPLALVYFAAYLFVAVPVLGHLPIFGSNAALRGRAWRDVSATVHRADPLVHDDFDLAFHVGARYRIGYLPASSMGMSMRPFSSGRALVLRVHRGLRTITVHWPDDLPPRRWQRVILHRYSRPRR